MPNIPAILKLFSAIKKPYQAVTSVKRLANPKLARMGNAYIKWNNAHPVLAPWTETIATDTALGFVPGNESLTKHVINPYEGVPESKVLAGAALLAHRLWGSGPSHTLKHTGAVGGNLSKLAREITLLQTPQMIIPQLGTLDQKTGLLRNTVLNDYSRGQIFQEDEGSSNKPSALGSVFSILNSIAANSNGALKYEDMSDAAKLIYSIANFGAMQQTFGRLNPPDEQALTHHLVQNACDLGAKTIKQMVNPNPQGLTSTSVLTGENDILQPGNQVPAGNGSLTNILKKRPVSPNPDGTPKQQPATLNTIGNVLQKHFTGKGNTQTSTQDSSRSSFSNIGKSLPSTFEKKSSAAGALKFLHTLARIAKTPVKIPVAAGKGFVQGFGKGNTLAESFSNGAVKSWHNAYSTDKDVNLLRSLVHSITDYNRKEEQAARWLARTPEAETNPLTNFLISQTALGSLDTIVQQATGAHPAPTSLIGLATKNSSKELHGGDYVTAVLNALAGYGGVANVRNYLAYRNALNKANYAHLIPQILMPGLKITGATALGTYANNIQDGFNNIVEAATKQFDEATPFVNAYNAAARKGDVNGMTIALSQLKELIPDQTYLDRLQELGRTVGESITGPNGDIPLLEAVNQYNLNATSEERRNLVGMVADGINQSGVDFGGSVGKNLGDSADGALAITNAVLQTPEGKDLRDKLTGSIGNSNALARVKDGWTDSIFDTEETRELGRRQYGNFKDALNLPGHTISSLNGHTISLTGLAGNKISEYTGPTVNNVRAAWESPEVQSLMHTGAAQDIMQRIPAGDITARTNDLTAKLPNWSQDILRTANTSTNNSYTGPFNFTEMASKSIVDKIPTKATDATRILTGTPEGQQLLGAIKKDVSDLGINPPTINMNGPLPAGAQNTVQTGKTAITDALRSKIQGN